MNKNKSENDIGLIDYINKKWLIRNEQRFLNYHLKEMDKNK